LCPKHNYITGLFYQIFQFKITYHTFITKDLDYLIIGDNAGSKLKRAEELKIKIIDEEAFLKVL